MSPLFGQNENEAAEKASDCTGQDKDGIRDVVDVLEDRHHHQQVEQAPGGHHGEVGNPPLVKLFESS